MDMGDTNEYDADAARQFSLHLHRKKQAANDAQLLMNRIALLQKEEERSIKKIEQTKERALEILAIRDENERRMQDLIEATDARKTIQKQQRQRNIAVEQEARRIKQSNAEAIMRKKREEAAMVQAQKDVMRKEAIEMERMEVEKKQKQRELIRKQEEDIKLKKELDKREQERRVHDAFLQRAKQEEQEAAKAEKMVRALERKEKEWIERLKGVQIAQETAFEKLGSALQADSIGSPVSGSGSGSSIPSKTSRNDVDFDTGLMTNTSRSSGSSRRSSSAARLGR